MITPFGLFSAYIIACLRLRRKGAILTFLRNLHISDSLRDFPECHFRNVACNNTESVDSGGSITGSDNLVIYGHHIKGGKMFGALEDYKSQSFYEEHKTIQFDTLTQRGEYEIIAVFKTVAYSSQGFRYYDFVNADSEDEFNAYIQKCKELALYETGVTAEYGDRLITLSTCEYSAQNGRLVVVAKKTA